MQRIPSDAELFSSSTSVRLSGIGWCAIFPVECSDVYMLDFVSILDMERCYRSRLLSAQAVRYHVHSSMVVALP